MLYSISQKYISFTLYKLNSREFHRKQIYCWVGIAVSSMSARLTSNTEKRNKITQNKMHKSVLSYQGAYILSLVSPCESIVILYLTIKITTKSEMLLLLLVNLINYLFIKLVQSIWNRRKGKVRTLFLYRTDNFDN